MTSEFNIETSLEAIEKYKNLDALRKIMNELKETEFVELSNEIYSLLF